MNLLTAGQLVNLLERLIEMKIKQADPKKNYGGLDHEITDVKAQIFRELRSGA